MLVERLGMAVTGTQHPWECAHALLIMESQSLFPSIQARMHAAAEEVHLRKTIPLTAELGLPSPSW